jgi:hypothetical protein
MRFGTVYAECYDVLMDRLAIRRWIMAFDVKSAQAFRREALAWLAHRGLHPHPSITVRFGPIGRPWRRSNNAR